MSVSVAAATACEANASRAPLLSVVTPTFNERQNIESHVHGVLDALEGWPIEVIVVDDNSPDGTWEATNALMNADARIRLVRRVGRRGLSSAVLEGALAAQGRYVAVIDADGQHDETLLPRMLERLQSGVCDIIVATRYADTGGADGLAGPIRKSLSRIATSAAKTLTKERLSDPMSGFFALDRDAVHAAAPRLQSDGFKILLDLVMALPEARLQEVPFVMRHRTGAASKFDLAVGWRFACAVVSHATGLPARFVSFGIVGAAGVAVNLAALTLLHKGLGVEFFSAQTVSIGVAATSNFALNTLLTYADRRPRGWSVLRALALFYLSCALAAGANLILSTNLFESGVPWWAAATAGGAAGCVWNFLASERLVWPR